MDIDMRTVFTALALSFSLAGCGDVSDPAKEPDVDAVDLLRATVSFDFDPYESPESMRQAVAFAGAGEVESISSAMIDQPEGPDTGAVVIGVRLGEVWKVDPRSKSESTAYVVLRRPTNISVESFSDSFPTGTRIAIFGDLSAFDLSEGAPPGPVYEPAPQGLIVETERSDSENVWGDEVNSSLPQWKAASTIAGVRSTLDVK